MLKQTIKYSDIVARLLSLHMDMHDYYIYILIIKYGST